MLRYTSIFEMDISYCIQDYEHLDHDLRIFVRKCSIEGIVPYALNVPATKRYLKGEEIVNLLSNYDGSSPLRLDIMKGLMKILRETLSYVYICYDIEKMYLEEDEMKLDDARDDAIEYYRKQISDLNMKFVKYRKYIEEIPKIMEIITNKIS
jgi:hypothetical protein